MNTTQRQMLIDWLDDRLGLVYLGLSQLAESPGYWETYYEDEIEPLESIRALIESSGDKACGAVEEAMVPAIELLVNHYLQESLAYGNSIHAKSYKAAIAVIKEALLAGAIAIMDRQNEAALSKPAPLPQEVEEAMIRMDNAINRAYERRLDNLGKSYAAEQKLLEDAALAVVRAALRPKVVSREWVDDLSARIDKIQFVTCPNDATLDTVERTIDELGIEVGEKP